MIWSIIKTITLKLAEIHSVSSELVQGIRKEDRF